MTSIDIRKEQVKAERALRKLYAGLPPPKPKPKPPKKKTARRG